MGTTAYAERRDPTAPRRPFRATVDLAPNEDHDAYQADAIDLSIGGMSIRTSLLPGVGEQLEFHFSLADGRPVEGRGEVVWSQDKGERAGAFGVKFTALPGEAEAAIRQAVEPQGAAPEVTGAPGAPGTEAVTGAAGTAGAQPATDETKVKLYIQGMDAPLRARVRARKTDVMVLGSDLSFLRLGEKVEVDGTRDRTAGTIESVDVEVDPRTRVPRLVLTVNISGRARTEAPAVTTPAVTVPVPVSAPAHDDAVQASGADPQSAIRTEPRSTPRVESRKIRNAAQATTVLADDDADDRSGDRSGDRAGDGMDEDSGDGMDDMSPGPSWLKGALGAARAWGERAASSAGPVMRGATGAVGAFGQRVTGLVRARIAGRDGEASGALVPAPRNGLRPQHATDSDVGADGAVGSTPRSRRVVVYAAAALALAAGIVAIASTGGPHTTTPHPQVTVAPGEPAAPGALPTPGDTAQTDPAAQGAHGTQGAPGAIASPTDPAGAVAQGTGQGGPGGAQQPSRVLAARGGYLPPDLAGAAGSPSNLADEQPILAIAHNRAPRQPGVQPGVRPGVQPGVRPTVRPTVAVAAAPVAAARPVIFGNPSVRTGTVLHLRMDGPITQLTGAGVRGASIVLVVPGRHSLDVASPLTRLDNRLMGAGIFNRATGAELTLRFRSPAPSFVARAIGNTVEIVLAPTPGAAHPRAAAPAVRPRISLGRRR